MREIKFRAWDKIKKIFLPTDVWAVVNTDFKAFGIMIEDFEEYREGEYFYKEFIELSQYTGLKDKNGKEVFEGDLIDYGFYGNKKILAEVVFQIGRYCLKVYENNEEYISEFHNDKDHETIWYEVIGSVFENPELLNGNI